MSEQHHTVFVVSAILLALGFGSGYFLKNKK